MKTVWVVMHEGGLDKMFDNHKAAKVYVYNRLYGAYHREEDSDFSTYQIHQCRVLEDGEVD